MQPVLSMPGSVYHKIALQVADWLSVVEQCQINTSTKCISENLKNIQLDDDDEVVSFDISSLYTNVPVQEATAYCTNCCILEDIRDVSTDVADLQLQRTDVNE